MHRHGPNTEASHDLNDTHEKSHVPHSGKKDMVDGIIPLSELPVGEWAIIFEVLGEGALRRRLLDMGLTPNTRVLLRKTAPLGDPLEIYVRGYDLSLRKADAALLNVIREGKS